MLKNHLKIAWRNLIKNKTFSFINIFGLITGLTSFLLIALYVFDEFTFDSFHKNADNIYRVVEYEATTDGQETNIAGAGYQVSQKVKTDVPGIEDAARLRAFGRVNVAATENTNVFYEDYTVGNPGFLTTFDFKLLQGDRYTALTEPYSVIVTEETAKKLYNSSDVLGKSIKVSNDSTLYKITAVLQDFPLNSHLSFNLLFSESSITDDDYLKFINTDWSSGNFRTYLLLNDKADAKTINREINQLVAARLDNVASSKITYQLQPLKKIHFYSNDITGDSGKKGNITYVYVFSILAMFVMFIACINYMNLTTARFANRTKEIAVRKVAGASRKNLVGQFLAEAFFITGIALGLALILVKILLPYFNAFTEKQLTLGIRTDPRIWFGIALIIFVVGLLSGLYPAFYQAAAKPISLFKRKIPLGKGNLSIRRLLVVFQFAVSIIMIFATIIVYLQMKYVTTKNMGFNKEQLLVVDINSGDVRRGAQTIKNEFAKLPQVKEVTVSSRVPGEWKDLPKVKVKNNKIQIPGGEDMYFIGVDDQFLKTYQVTLAKGRNFAAESLADSSAVIINQTAANALGIKEPSDQIIEIPLDIKFSARVIGIVKDFNFQSLREPVAPVVLGFQKNPVQNIDYFTMRMTTNSTAETLKQMEAILHRVDQSHLFEYHFLDQQWNLFYREDKIRETIFFIVAILTIVIACLGLFGLATYAAEQRTKEIGIRKVLGASVSSIVAMLSKDFIRLIIIASVFALPVAGWAMHTWLHDFAYRINLSWWVFVVAGFIALCIALLTVSFKAIKAAIANPVQSLRTE